jgi:hypothetical protein
MKRKLTMKKSKKIIFILMIVGITSSQVNAAFTFTWGDVADYLGIGGGDIEDSASLVEETISDQLGVLGELGSMCYVYDPPSLGALHISANICSLMGNVNITSPCKSAPPLPGFKKVDRFGNLDLKRYCENIFGTEIIFNIDKIVPEIDLNKNIFAVSAKGSYSIPTNYNLSEVRENLTMFEAVKNNNFEATYVYNALLNSSKKKPKDLDVSQLNVAYTTKEDYSKSVNVQVENFSTMHDQLDLNKFKKNCLIQFRKINTLYSDFADRKKQKAALKGELLEEYRKITEKYAIFKRNQRTLLEHRDPVVNPTKEFIDAYEPKHRASIIYTVEKQKTHRAKIYAEVEQEVAEMNRKVILIVDKTLYATHEFDRDKALKEIKKLIGK